MTPPIPTQTGTEAGRGWAGWIRQGRRGRWRKVCAADSYGDTWSLLLAFRVAGSCERICVPYWQVPKP